MSLVYSTVYDYLLDTRDARGGGLAVLIDPDKLPPARLPAFAAWCEGEGVDALFVGGSLIHTVDLDQYVAALKRATRLPVVGFPGSLTQVVRPLDAVLYLSIISGRNPEYLIGQHVQAAPLIRQLGLEAISTGYMLVESGRMTTAQFMSGSMPLPRHKPDLAAATALAGEMMGMKLLFADGGSGADAPVPVETIQAIAATCRAPLLVGGGLRTPEAVAARIDAGAAFAVVGTAFERDDTGSLLGEMVAAAHPRAEKLAQ